MRASTQSARYTVSPAAISWRGTLQQYAGRLHRLHTGKAEVRVYDYIDRAVPMFSRMFNNRRRGYEAVGYTIREDRAPACDAAKNLSGPIKSCVTICDKIRPYKRNCMMCKINLL